MLCGRRGRTLLSLPSASGEWARPPSLAPANNVCSFVWSLEAAACHPPPHYPCVPPPPPTAFLVPPPRPTARVCHPPLPFCATTPPHCPCVPPPPLPFCATTSIAFVCSRGFWRSVLCPLSREWCVWYESEESLRQSTNLLRALTHLVGVVGCEVYYTAR